MRLSRFEHSIRPKIQCGFTLIELLVVLSIVSLLIALLLPALGKARASARVTQCGSNTRSITFGLIAYTNDFADYIPYSAHQVPTAVTGYPPGDLLSWWDRLAGIKSITPIGYPTVTSYSIKNSGATYVPWNAWGRNQVWYCPCVAAELNDLNSVYQATTVSDNASTQVQANYGLNMCLGAYSDSQTQTGGGNPYVWGNLYVGSEATVVSSTVSGQKIVWADFSLKKLSLLNKSSATALLGDAAFSDQFNTTHGRWNLFINQSNIAEWGSTIWGAANAPWPIARPDIGSGITWSKPNYTSIQPVDKTWHNGSMSLSFIDGHVSQLDGISSKMFMTTNP